MNYEIIKDEDELKKFIDWLPDLTEEEQLYLSLFTRKKYCDILTHPWVKADKNHLRRFTSKKERLISKIKRLQCPVGSYQMRGKGDTEFTVPQESLVLYITPNPRNLWKSTIQGLIDLAKMVQCESRSSNPHQEILSTIQRTPSYKRTITFDYDEKNPEILDRVKEICGTAYDVVETRGGYHVMVWPKEMPKKEKWYQALSEIPGLDQKGDLLLPVPGCFQGGHVSKFIVKNH